MKNKNTKVELLYAKTTTFTSCYETLKSHAAANSHLVKHKEFNTK